MNAVNPRRRAPARAAAGSFTSQFAIQCARNIFAAVERHMPEAPVLATWLLENAASFGLPENAVPDDDWSQRRRRGVTAADWKKLRAALAKSESPVLNASKTAADMWIAAVGTRLTLDALETHILALALQYRLDQRVERLWDMISSCRGRPGRFMRDAELVSLLLAAPRADVAPRLAGPAKLLASGVLHLGSQADVSPLERLVWMIRRDTLPAPDIYDQLLGSFSAEPLGWAAFSHLGREADVAADVLRAAIAGREAGVNILLYGPSGTGKISRCHFGLYLCSELDKPQTTTKILFG